MVGEASPSVCFSVTVRAAVCPWRQGSVHVSCYWQEGVRVATVTATAAATVVCDFLLSAGDELIATRLGTSH